MSKRRLGSPAVTPAMAAKIKHLCAQGFMQHDVAARFGINQGRVSEVINGKRYAEVSPDAAPPDNPQPELPF